ncbi:MAG TPA: ComF family protein [Campylobacterales bacterium]|nr:ComF family protein [Campylobacterales bacterium]
MSEIKLDGNWKAGWAIELHTLKSIPIGSGYFDTTYTRTGEALNKLKYHNDHSQIPILAKISIDFLKTRLVTPYIDVMIPVPPSNYDRAIQPVFEVAKVISESLNIPVDFNYIKKIKQTTQLKDIVDLNAREDVLKDAFRVKDTRYKDRNILLFDDLYRSGSTLKEITNILYKCGRVQNVYVLTLTKTRVKR